MDGTETSRPPPAVGASRCWSQLVGGRIGGGAALGVSPDQNAVGADLGGSSNYSNENLEDRRGKVPCEEQLDMGESVIRARSTLIRRTRSLPGASRSAFARKGIGSKSWNADRGSGPPRRRRKQTWRRWRKLQKEFSFLLDGPIPWNGFALR